MEHVQVLVRGSDSDIVIFLREKISNLMHKLLQFIGFFHIALMGFSFPLDAKNSIVDALTKTNNF